MKRMWRALVIAAGVSIIGLLVIAVPVFAADLPDSTPTVEGFWVYRNLLESGDWFILIYFNIPYATAPDEPVWQTFTWRMLAMDEVTELGAELPPAFNNDGYGYNVASMYFSAADVAALGLAWNTAYPMRLSCNPALFADPQEYNFNLSAADYSTGTLTSDEQAELAASILTVASELDIRWGLGTTYSLLSETGTGTVLSIYGESFFRSAVYGLQGLCPGVFAYTLENIDLTARTFTGTYISILDMQYTGTWAQVSKDAGKAIFGTTYDMTALLVSLIFIAIIAACVMYVSGDPWHGISDARTGLIVMTRLGFFGLGSLGLICALFAIYGASRLWKVLS